MQQLANLEEIDSKEKNSCIKRALYDGRKQICVNLKTDTDKLIVVVHRYWIILYLKFKELKLKLSENPLLSAKPVYVSSYLEIFFKRCIVLDQTTTHIWNKVCHECIFSA